jgi:hypothetical protein
MFNPFIRGWIKYYSHFHKSELYPTLQRIDVHLVRWARRRKINELERTLAKVQVMKEMLEAVMSCRCQDLAQCARSLGSRPAQSQTAQERPSRQL